MSIELDLDPAVAVGDVLAVVPPGLTPVSGVVAPSCRLSVRVTEDRWAVEGADAASFEGPRQAALQHLEDALYRCLMVYPPHHVMVHAGVVGWGGRAIVFPGATHSGKTTLAVALAREGASLYSDDLAVFGTDGRVRPYDRPLLLRPEGRRAPAHELGLAVGEEPLEVAMVVLTEYRTGARWRPRVVTAGEGLLAMLAHAPASTREPERVLSTLLRALDGAVVIRGRRDEAAPVSRWILSQPCLQAASRPHH